MVMKWCAIRGSRLFRIRAVMAIAIAALCMAVACLVVLAWPMDTHRYLSAASSPEMRDRCGKLMFVALNPQEQWCLSRSLLDLGPRIANATVAAEDHRFYSHPGVDPMALARAAWQNLTRKRIVSGASTLTMQVVKDSPESSRSLSMKVLQFVRALRLECRTDKDEVLCAYLNKVPYGLNLIGAEAAAWRYFGKPARELTLGEAALLAGLPKAPAAFEPLRHPERALSRRNYVLKRMLCLGFITEAEYRETVGRPVRAAWHDFPRQAHHLAVQLRPKMQAEQQVEVTLDSRLQERAENIARATIQSREGHIDSIAIMVVDVPTASVLVRVGSADYFSRTDGAQLDGCRARRSPGSALKPFTYALAIERNTLYPSEMLLDDTVDFGNYHPGNFDGTFTGVLSACDALKRSLNVPAVMVLNRLGVNTFHRFLCLTGLTTLARTPEAYGLGLTLGNCEVRLDELMAAYTMLANLGEYRPLKTVEGDGMPNSRRCLGRGTCLALYEMLEQRFPEGLPEGLVRVADRHPRVCWKTGTSTGHFDAWAFAFNVQYVVGVWMGNSSGRAAKELVGVEAALPVVRQIFETLPQGSGPSWPDPGDDLRHTSVCAVSGLPALPWCPRTKHIRLPKEQFLQRVCDMHRPAPLDSVKRALAPKQGSSMPAVERWPGSVKGWDLAAIPETPSDTTTSRRNEELPRQVLRILDPPDQSKYALTGERNGDRLRVRSSLDTESELHWYQDDQYLGTSTPVESLVIALRPGNHILACMTASGLHDRVTFSVAPSDSRIPLSVQ